MKSRIIKRTVYINGRKTGVCLEDAFWSTLKEIAQTQGVTVSQTVTEIDKSRQAGTLSSAIRLFVLDRVRSKKRGPPWGKTAAPNKRRQLRGYGDVPGQSMALNASVAIKRGSVAP
jgi:predicted DNA-binding ribbon-helix-helix protein